MSNDDAEESEKIQSDERERKTKRAHRSPHGAGLFVTDAEMYELLGVPADVARVTVRSLDQNPASHFPKKQPLWGNRRYYPAVRQWFDRTYGVKVDRPNPRDV